MTVNARVLLVEDDPAMAEFVRKGLARKGFDVECRPSAAEALEALASEAYEAFVTDVNMPGGSGLELVSRHAARRTDIPAIVITAFGSLDSAIEAIRAGAYDFITKPFEIEQLHLSLKRAIEHRRLSREVKRLRAESLSPRALPGLLGSSEAMAQVAQLVQKVKDLDSTVLIRGETGTGKEVVARALHEHGRRASGPFVALNCAAVPEALLESELFGHVRGAFTDARADRDGLFVQASGGTLFLDELGEMPLGVQAKLLRALEERTVRPVGASADRPFDTRLIAATHRDLEAAVEQGAFRSDLYFRVNVIAIELPPLRARDNDVLELAQHFVRVFATRAGRPVRGLTSAAAGRLLEYTWPGNVRELANAIERAVALTSHEDLLVEDLPDRVRSFSPSQFLLTTHDPGDLVTLAEVERRYILKVLESVGGEKTRAAEILGIDRKTLYRKLEAYKAGA